MNLAQFETACGNELGLNTTAEKTTIDDAINAGVLRVLEDTHCYVKKTDFTGFDGTSVDYTMDSGRFATENGCTRPSRRGHFADRASCWGCFELIGS